GLRLGVAERLGELVRAMRRPRRFGARRPPEENPEPGEAEGSQESGAPEVLVGAIRVRALPGAAIEVGGGAVGREPLGIGRRPQERVDRARPVVAAREVVREQGGALGRHLARLGLEEEADALVELTSLLEQQALVRDLLGEALAEPVLVGGEEMLTMKDAPLLEVAQLVV